MKKYIILPTVLILIGCLNKDAPSVNPFSQSEIFLELQLQSEIQFVGKWKVRRVSSTSNTSDNTQSKNNNQTCQIYNFEMFNDNTFIIKSVDADGNYGFITGKYATYYEEIVVQDEIPFIYLFQDNFNISGLIDYSQAFATIENLVFTPEGAQFDYFPIEDDYCLNSSYNYEAEKEELVLPQDEGDVLNSLFNNWNLRNLIVTVDDSSQTGFQCEVIRQTFEECFNSGCEIPERISLDLTPYGSYYWKYLSSDGSIAKIEDAFWKFDETDATGRSLFIKYDEQTPWLDSYPILIEELSETDLILIESRQDITYTYRLTLNEVESCEF
jgi:hypothetical protein